MLIPVVPGKPVETLAPPSKKISAKLVSPQKNIPPRVESQTIKPISEKSVIATQTKNPIHTTPPSNQSTLPQETQKEYSGIDVEYGLLPPQPVYYSAFEVSRRPQVVNNINFMSPELLELGISGKAILTLYINTYGAIDFVEIEETDFDEEIRRKIINEFSKMTFSPALKDDLQVNSKMKIEVILQKTPSVLIDAPKITPSH